MRAIKRVAPLATEQKRRNAQAVIRRLRQDLSPGATRADVLCLHGSPGDPVSDLVHQAGAEVVMGERLLASAAGRPQLSGRGDVRDLLIEARLHVATADNHLDLLQIHLEREARTWTSERELGRREGRR